ncbi:MAG: putative hydroxymethylpyrimidine transporter CytX, partial [Solirubrobacterales bacterium]
MYILGMLITIYFGMDVIEFLSANSFKLLGILIILFSTVTTTFLDIYSAVISSKQIFKFENDNLVILIYTVLATILAYIFPIESYQNFLLTIGSVFIPVYTIVFTDYLLKSDKFEGGFNFLGVLLAAAGTALYSWLSGNSFGIPTVIVLFSISLCYLTFKRIFNFRGVVNE